MHGMLPDREDAHEQVLSFSGARGCCLSACLVHAHPTSKLNLTQHATKKLVAPSRVPLLPFNSDRSSRQTTCHSLPSRECVFALRILRIKHPHTWLVAVSEGDRLPL